MNQSGKSIADLDAVWRYEDIAGRIFNGATLTTGDLLLFPPSIPAKVMKVMTYEVAIFPGSKRYLAEQGMAGDNSDVRGREPDEVWHGGRITGSGETICAPALRVKSVTLILDGVFFADGGLWESVTGKAKSMPGVAQPNFRKA